MNIIITILVSLLFTFYSKYVLNMLQLEGYKNKMYLNWISSNFIKTLTEKLKYKSQGLKKPLVYTMRVKRLITVLFILNFAILFLIIAKLSFPINIIGILFVYIFHAYIVMFANIIAMPIEKIIANYYMNDAKKILSNRGDLIKIGITGSFGKTSTKFILTKILSEKYNVLVTPNSFNTPMGVTITVRKSLKKEHEVFICEMGARHIGDIKQLCKIVSPKMGIITSIGEQHLETFKNIENIANTKYEIIESLPSDGFAIFCNDFGESSKLYDRAKIEKALFGIEKNKNQLLFCENIKSTQEGSKFEIVDFSGNRVECKTILLGKHNIINIMACATLAFKLGMTLEEIACGVSKIEPIEHRLQIVPSSNGIIVIDDAFNANPAGTKSALDVIKGFDGKKIIITPGMVELGAREYELNKEFGKNMADVVDYAILVGKDRAKPMEEGLRGKKFDNNKILVVESLDDAMIKISTIAKAGDVILFENDLPDNY